MMRARGSVLMALVLTVTLAACGTDVGSGSGGAAGTGSFAASAEAPGAVSSIAPAPSAASAPASASSAASAPASAPAVGDDGNLTWGNGKYGVVLAHGAAFDAASWKNQAAAIAAQGATVVAVQDIGTDSITAAVAGLRARGIDKVALVGGSAGADAILQLASEQPDLADQLVLLSPNTVVTGLGPAPKLFIASQDEPGADIPQKLVDANPEGSQVLLVPGGAHAQNVFDTDQGPTVLAAMLARLPGGHP